MECNESPKALLYKKMNAMRAKLVTLDWTPDGTMKLSSVPTKYISITQAKANIAPLFPEFGLEFSVNMKKPELIDTGSRQWMVGIDVAIIDIDTDESIEYEFWGYGTGDKGVAIATSYALKTMFSSVFCFADGMDPEKDNISSSTPAFTPRTDREREDILSKVAQTSVKMAPRPNVPKPAPTVTTSKPAEVAPAPTSTPAPATQAPAAGKPMSPMQGKAIAKIIEELGEQVQQGSLTDDVYQSKKLEAESINTAEAARKFITENRVL